MIEAVTSGLQSRKVKSNTKKNFFTFIYFMYFACMYDVYHIHGLDT